MNFRTPAVGTALLLVATPAFAHTGAGATQGFAAGLLHPLLGIDHVLAMVAVGLWAGLIGGRAVWAWPAAFLGAMVLGATFGMAGVSFPSVETGIAASVVVLGVAVAWRARLSVVAGVALRGVFALFHGYAHGAEFPAAAGAASYVAGLSLATAFLHGVGVAVGVGSSVQKSAWLPRLAGAGMALAGVALLIG